MVAYYIQQLRNVHTHKWNRSC